MVQRDSQGHAYTENALFVDEKDTRNVDLSGVVRLGITIIRSRYAEVDKKEQNRVCLNQRKPNGPSLVNALSPT